MIFADTLRETMNKELDNHVKTHVDRIKANAEDHASMGEGGFDYYISDGLAMNMNFVSCLLSELNREGLDVYLEREGPTMRNTVVLRIIWCSEYTDLFKPDDNLSDETE